MKNLLLLFLLSCSAMVMSQQVYKTPSGKKYHSVTCTYVKNVSQALTVKEAKSMGLSPCSKCNPGVSTSNLSTSTSALGIKSGEAQGERQATQCRATTKKGNRCKRMTKNTNGYCFQHER